jgi:hypothetical protein
MIVVLYVYPNGVISEIDRAPAGIRSRTAWRFEIQAEQRGVAVRYASTRWEERESTRHKWKGCRVWYAEIGDVGRDLRSFTSDYLAPEAPEIPDAVLQRAMGIVRGTVHFDGPAVARKRR